MPSVHRPKPQPLRKISRTQRRWFLVFLGLGIALIGLGWIVTIRTITREVLSVTMMAQERLDEVSEYTSRGHFDVLTRHIRALDEAFQAMKAGYQFEKNRP